MADAIGKTFTAVRAALPEENAAAFDSQLEAITRAPALDLSALDDLLACWWRIATLMHADPEGWQQMLRVAAEITAGTRQPGRLMADVLADHGITVTA